MLEQLCASCAELAKPSESSSLLVVLDDESDGAVLLARCDGRHLDLLRIFGRKHLRNRSEGTGQIEQIWNARLVATPGAEVSAMAWLPAQEEKRLLCVCFKQGCVSLYVPDSLACISFLLWPTTVCRIRVGPEPPEGDRRIVLFVHSDAVVAIMRAEDLSVGSPAECLEHDGQFEHELYELDARAQTTDICYHPCLRALDDVFEADVVQGLIAVGTQPFLSQHALTDDNISMPVPSLIKTAGAAVSVVASNLKSWLPFKRPTPSSPVAEAVPATTTASAGAHRGRRPDRIASTARFVDPSRSGELLELAPLTYSQGGSSGSRSCGRRASLAVTCDAFGRVGLFCVETLRCIYMWKGYRDAQVAWIWSSPRPANAQQAPPSPTGSGDRRLALVIYAPIRGLLEIWDVADTAGPRRLDARSVDCDGRLLSTLDHSAYLLRPSGRVDRIRLKAEGEVAERSQPGSDAGSDDFGSASSGDDGTCLGRRRKASGSYGDSPSKPQSFGSCMAR
eukprot:TRINITY_DN38337_c0_g1_i1.p1 TRINITY_DN38337_c0_g1~~TRINITY_DN38337_c0_g1_i1.p1  ORF type:complete len:507 (+),score=68.77 TRINITY_DN38337_c0_g1_i1:67-1587(+)